MDGGMDEAEAAMTNSTLEAASESEPTTLESMGYVDGDPETRETDGHSAGSQTSRLKTAIIITTVAVFVGCLLYYVIGGILLWFGIV